MLMIIAKIVVLALLFLGALQEIGTKSWPYIGKSLFIALTFVVYGWVGFRILLSKQSTIPNTSAGAALVTFGFLFWLLVGVIGMILASPKE